MLGHKYYDEKEKNIWNVLAMNNLVLISIMNEALFCDF